MSIIRGLDVRIMLAHARILQISDEPKSRTAMDEVREEAVAEGYRDASKRIYDPPTMFEGEPRLLGCWTEGQGLFFVDSERTEYIGFEDAEVKIRMSEADINSFISALNESAKKEGAKTAIVSFEPPLVNQHRSRRIR